MQLLTFKFQDTTARNEFIELLRDLDYIKDHQGTRPFDSLDEVRGTTHLVVDAKKAVPEREVIDLHDPRVDQWSPGASSPYATDGFERGEEMYRRVAAKESK